MISIWGSILVYIVKVAKVPHTESNPVPLFPHTSPYSTTCHLGLRTAKPGVPSWAEASSFQTPFVGRFLYNRICNQGSVTGKIRVKYCRKDLHYTCRKSGISDECMNF